MALSLMAYGRHDVRPHLLRLLWREASSAVEPCLRYGADYLIAWCRQSGESIRLDVIEAAAADALALTYWGRATRGRQQVPAASRAKQLHVRRGYFLLLRNVAARAYGRRLIEAVDRFRRASGYGSGRLPPAPWHYGFKRNALSDIRVPRA